MANQKIYGRLQTILASPSRVNKININKYFIKNFNFFKFKNSNIIEISADKRRILDYYKKLKDDKIRYDNEKFSKRINKG